MHRLPWCRRQGGRRRLRDLTSADWQSSVTDEHIQKIIVYGGSAVGKAATMPANPDLDAKPEVVAELVKYIRGLAK